MKRRVPDSAGISRKSNHEKLAYLSLIKYIVEKLNNARALAVQQPLTLDAA